MNLKTLRYLSGKVIFSLRTFGLIPTASKSIQYIKKSYSSRSASRFIENISNSQKEEVNSIKRYYPGEVQESSEQLLRPYVLLVAELSIPQCKKYRVDQKVLMLSHLGYETRVVSWHEIEAVRSALQLCTAVIFYRVPGLPGVLGLIREAKRLNVKSYWEVDDLIFDVALYKQNKNIKSLRSEEVHGLLSGADLYRDAMIECDEAILSTPVLAEIASEHTNKRASVVRNALDQETLLFATEARLDVGEHSEDKVIIVYGSGTKTHDVDFLEAAEGIEAALANNPHVIFRIIGPLELPKSFDKFSSQIQRIKFTDFRNYMKLIADSDIGIAPLDNSIFNDCKSNIKFLEYASAEIPTVASRAQQFVESIDNDITGIIAGSPNQWRDALEKLIHDKDLRKSMGRRAKEVSLSRYSIDVIARNELIGVLPSPRRSKTVVLMANIFFKPQSFGGATIVAEQLAKSLVETGDYEVFVFCSWANEGAPAGSLVRYQLDGINVVGLRLPPHLYPEQDYKDSLVSARFKDVLEAIDPDIVHLHAIQDLGGNLVEITKAHNIPVVVTLHDAWWICGRQFMINNNGVYCGQKQIDLRICDTCVDDRRANRARSADLAKQLSSADLLLAPSKFFADLYASNNFDPQKIRVNKNGIRPPAEVKSREYRERLRFGYVGGNTPIKGFDVVLESFKRIEDKNVTLVMVDNTMNLGYRSMHINEIAANIDIKIVGAYTQDNIDSFFSGIDVLIFPTQWKESFGLTVREALVRNVWVIVTDAGGVVEDIVEGENGYIIPLSRNPVFLSEAIEKTIQHFEKLEKPYVNQYAENITLFSDQTLDLIKHYRSLQPSPRQTESPEDGDCRRLTESKL